MVRNRLDGVPLLLFSEGTGRLCGLRSCTSIYKEYQLSKHCSQAARSITLARAAGCCFGQRGMNLAVCHRTAAAHTGTAATLCIC
jgi:hypothetical protein